MMYLYNCMLLVVCSSELNWQLILVCLLLFILWWFFFRMKLELIRLVSILLCRLMYWLLGVIGKYLFLWWILQFWLGLLLVLVVVLVFYYFEMVFILQKELLVCELKFIELKMQNLVLVLKYVVLVMLVLIRQFLVLWVMLCGLWEYGFRVNGLCIKKLIFSVLVVWNGLMCVVLGLGRSNMLDLWIDWNL